MKESSVVILKLKGTDKFLFLMRREGWCLPGGKKDDGEDFLTCAYRELLEETGIRVDPKKKMYIFLGTGLSINGRIVNVFYTETDKKEVILSSEHSEYKWVNWNKIKKLKLAGNTGDFISFYKRL